MSERWEDEDDDFDPGDPYRSHLEAYSAEMGRLGLISHLFEYHVVNDEYRAAGTCDRLYVLGQPLITPNGEILPVGTMVVGDLKTGKSLDFSAPGYSVQLAIYAAGRRYNTEKDEYLADQPDVNQDWGILVHMPSDRPECTMLWVDLSVGRWGAYLTQQIREWRKNWRKGEFGLGTITSPAIAEMGEVIDIDQADAEWITEMGPFIQDRLAQIKDIPDARKRLQLIWPDDIAPKNLREGEVTVAQMVTAHKTIARIEAEFELQFVTGGPTSSGHKDGESSTTPPSHRQMSLLEKETQS